MDNGKLQILIKKTVTPRAGISALLMGLSAAEKFGEAAGNDFFAAVLALDVYKAALLASCRPAPFFDIYRDAVLKRLSLPDGDFTEKELLASLELSADELFSQNAEYINEKLLHEAFSDEALTMVGACRLMRYCLENTEAETAKACEALFCEALARYDSRADGELTKLLPFLFEHECAAAVTRLTLTLGTERLLALYPSFFEEIKGILESGIETAALWDAYFCLLFSQKPDVERLLLDGLWFFTTYASDENYPLIAQLFFLSAAENLPIDHEIFDYADYEAPPDSPSRALTLRFERLIESRYSDGHALCETLKKLEICNPYANEKIGEIHVRDNQKEALLASSVVSRFFENGFSGREVLRAYFNTDLKTRLALEDLLLIAKRYEKFEEMFEILAKQEFAGAMKNINRGKFLLQPHSYSVLALHPERLEYALIEQFSGGGEQDLQKLEGRTVYYKIIGFEQGEIQVDILTESFTAEGDESHWENVLIWLRGVASNQKTDVTVPANYKEILLERSVDSFISDSSFDDITESLKLYPNSLPLFFSLFSKAKWNAPFVSPEHALEAQFFSKLKKYTESGKALFRALFASDMPPKDIVNFYMKTIYKAIVPFDWLLVQTDKETMLSALEGQPVYCRLREGEKRAQCRLINILSSPVCNVSDVDDYHDFATVRTVVADFSSIFTSVTRINLKLQSRGSLTREERSELFAFLSRNITVKESRRRWVSRLPDSHVCDIREMSFNMKCLEEAVALRRFSAESAAELIAILGDKNFFGFCASPREQISYLHLCMRDTETSSVENLAEQLILNAESAEVISEIYLNTHIKYFITAPRLVELIKARNSALLKTLGEMFKNRAFVGVVDGEGKLWSLYLPSGVGGYEDYKNSAVEFSLTADESGVRATVLGRRADSDGILEVIKLLKIGRASVSQFLPFLEKTVEKEALQNHDYFLRESITRFIREGADKRKLPNLSRYKEEVGALTEAREAESWLPYEYGERIAKFVERHRYLVSLEDMEALVASVSAEFIKAASEEEFASFYTAVFPNYSYNCRDNGIVYIWHALIKERFGNEAADNFIEKMKQNKRFKKNC